jgi:hypothetical protein
MKSIATAILGAVLCTGCAPLPITVASLVADGLSYATTEKSLTDHGISALAAQDCAVHRILTDGVVCQDLESETVIANVDEKVETRTLASLPRPQPVATPKGNVAVTHYGAIGDPIPGVYMVVASSRDLMTARSFGIRDANMTPQVFAMPAGGRRVLYHVIVGPITRDNFTSARKTAAAHGFKNTWALKIDNNDWRRSKELENRERLRRSAERAGVTKVYQPGS